MKALAEIIEQKKKKRSISPPDDKTVGYFFNAAVREEFGEAGSAAIKIEQVQSKKIFAFSHSTHWAAEFFIRRQKIAAKINKALGKEIIKEIKIKSV